jgi:hypothetical protein
MIHNLEKMEVVYKMLRDAGLANADAPPELAFIAGFLVGNHAREHSSNALTGLSIIENIMRVGIAAGMTSGSFEAVLAAFKQADEDAN